MATNKRPRKAYKRIGFEDRKKIEALNAQGKTVDVKYLSDKAYGKSKSEKEAELREQKLQAEIALKESQGEMHRLKTEIASGKYIDIEEVKMDYSRFFVSFKKFALSLPSRLSGRISGHCDPMEIRSIEKDLNAEIIRLLNSFVVAGCTPEEMEKKKRGKKSVS